ncbi:MAG: TonB-dependent receptor [Ignavibacteriaceae bacterium]|nr:TonB-dependent receptor [Ignavibacteriaceae bacterium]
MRNCYTSFSFLLFLLFLIVFNSDLLPQSRALLKGKITDESKDPLIGANIILRGTGLGASSDFDGQYVIRNIKPGKYRLEVTFVGYEKFITDVELKPSENKELNIKLKSTTFTIGGIEVIGTTELLPKDVNTKTVITSGEIEHFQASSIKDVLDLVPGVQKTDNPGLGKTTQIATRGEENDALSAFGTLVIIDGAPVSNNANLQFERMSGSKFGGNNMGGGVDLRTIPADNIERLEIITGLPSVRYGDVTAGIINVSTRIGAAPHRLKVKNNPDTREANLGGGLVVGEGSLSYNVNAAQSLRDIRVNGDEYLRLTGQIAHSAEFFDKALSWNNKLMYQTIRDEEEPKGDLLKTRNYNRSFTINYSSWGKFKPEDEVSVVDFNFFTTMRRENTMKSRLRTEFVILPTGDTLSNYIGKVETKGIEWTIGGRMEYNRVFFTGDFINRFMIGVDPQYNVNTGPGVLFDTLLSYYGVDAGRRPYKFDDIPGQLLTSIYLEHKVTGNLIFDFNLMFGFRYEMYRPYKVNLSGLWGDGQLVNSHQGTFFNPRFNLLIYLSETNQLRFSAGASSKSPPMSTLYPPETVMQWKDPTNGIVQYFRYNNHEPELKGARESLFEIAYDHKFFNQLGATVSAYYKIRKNEPEGWPSPVFAITSDTSAIYYVDSKSYQLNTGKTENKGVEFSLRTSRIKPLNMEFQVTGAYNRSYYPGTVTNYSSTPTLSLGQFPNYIVQFKGSDTLIGWTYPSSSTWRDRVQLNYYVKYTLAPLGIWITLRAEQLLSERSRNYNIAPVALDSLTEAQKLDREFSTEVKVKPNKWLFSINVSKSLFPGAEVSFYVNNLFDEPAIRTYNSSRTVISQEKRNPDLFYGIEFSMIVDRLLGGRDVEED